MKILVISDTHGELTRTQHVFLENRQCKRCFHLGDVGYDTSLLPQITYVRGNHDPKGYIEEHVLDIMGWKTWILHGHIFEFTLVEAMEKQPDLWKSWDVCMDILYTTIVSMAKKKGCQLVLFGHTHTAYFEKRDGIYLCNPGSLCFSHDGRNPSYAILTFNETDIQCTHHFISF